MLEKLKTFWNAPTVIDTGNILSISIFIVYFLVRLLLEVIDYYV